MIVHIFNYEIYMDNNNIKQNQYLILSSNCM